MTGRPEGSAPEAPGESSRSQVQARGSHGRDCGFYLELMADEGTAPALVLVGCCWPRAGPRTRQQGDQGPPARQLTAGW